MPGETNPIADLFYPGRRVRISRGALMGVEGIVLAQRGDNRLLVEPLIAQTGISILVQNAQVEVMGF